MSSLDATAMQNSQELSDLRLRGVPFLAYRDEAGAQHARMLDARRVLTIGRGAEVDLRLDWDPSVSLVHAEVIPVGAHWLIADDGVSRNGTFVNGRRLRGRRRLRDGDLIHVGRTVLSYGDPTGERREATTLVDARSRTGMVTVLFTDLARSTEMLDALGDADGDRVMRLHLGLLREVAREHGGEEVKSLGDGLMVAFESASAALSCAVQMQQRVASQSPVEGSGLALRIGVNAGETISVDGDYFGRTVVIARRLCDIAGDGEIVASDLVRSLLGSASAHRFQSLGPLQLKGLAEAVSASRLDWR